MANVSFLRGTQAKLDTLLAKNSGYQEGAFYLTTDSDRLYFAQSSTELVHLNHNVIHVASVSQLPAIADATVGDFYYAIAENVLCTKSATSATWVQINKNTDTNDDTKVTGVDNAQVVANEQGITISFNIKQSTTDIDKEVKQLADIPVSFTIKSSDIATSNNISVGVATSAVTGGVKIATEGDGASTNGFEVTGGDNVTVARDSSGNVSIAAKDTTYALSAANNKLVLTDSNNEAVGEIAVSSGNDAITVAAADNGLSVTHKAYASKAAVSTAATADPGYGGTFTVVDSITTDKGHVTAYNLKTVSMPAVDNTTSALSVEEGNIIRLTESNNETNDVTLAAGNTDIVLTSDTEADKITIAHKAYDALVADDKSIADVNADHGSSFTVVDSITASNGHITGYKTKKIVLPADSDTTNKSAAISADKDGKLTVTVTDSKDEQVTATSDAVLYYTVNGKAVYNQGTIDFYTKDEIDTKIEAVNAMTYKGTVGTGGTVATLPASGVQVGDTYKVAVAGTYGGHGCDVGDLLIATGNEVDGVITSGLVWTYVPSGDDTDSQYELNVANNVITLKNTTANEDVGSATVAAGKDMAVTTSGSTITVAHATIAAPTKGTDVAADFSNDLNAKTITVLDSITTDNGHVTGYTNKVITLPADKDTTSVLSAKANGVIRLTESDNETYDVTLAAGNDYIAVASSDNNEGGTITLSHKSYSTTLTPTTEAELKLDANDTQKNFFTVVTGVERDAGGHLSKVTTKKITIPKDNDTTSSIAVEDGNVITLSESNGESSSVTFAAGTQMAVTSNVDDKTITVAHGTVSTTTDSEGTVELNYGGDKNSFTVLSSVALANGHITNYKTKTFTLPALPEDQDTTYSYGGALSVANNVATYTTTLTGSDNESSAATLELTSNSIDILEKNGKVCMDLTWGEF